jgi:DNA-binding SARP family transcriptional activator
MTLAPLRGLTAASALAIVPSGARPPGRAPAGLLSSLCGMEAEKVTHLSIRLLGSMQVTRNGQPVTHFETEKARVLLAYLAVEADQPHPRELLAEMLWPGRPAGAASANLRHTLASLRRTIGDTPTVLSAGRQTPPSLLLATRQTIQLNSAGDAWVDVRAFSMLLRSSQPPGLPALASLEEAIGLVRGAFLEDISVTGSPDLEEWLLLTREQLGRMALEARRRLAECYEQSGDYGQALQHARRGVENEPWDEGDAAAGVHRAAQRRPGPI